MQYSDFVALVLIGALCSLDTVSVAQAMFSRPLVSATLGAGVLGHPWEGIIVGAVLELFALETMPFGASRYPEWGSAGVVAGAAFSVAGSRTAGALAIATLAALATAGLGSISMVWHRKFVARTAGGLRDALARGSASAVARLHVVGIASDLWRGAMVTSIGLLALLAFEPRLVRSWGLSYGPSLAVPLILAVAVGGGSTLRAVRGTAGARWYLAAGLAVGIALVLAR